MSELGSYLRRTRIEKQISLDFIAESTRIRKRYLEAIEDGDFSVMPGAFYVRAFIKSYAEALGLNAEELISSYLHELPQISSETTTETSTSMPITSPTPVSGTKNRWGVHALVAAFVVLLGVMIYVFYSSETDNNPVVKPDNTNNQTNQQTEPKDDKNTDTTKPTDVKEPEQPQTPVNPTQVTLTKSQGSTDYYMISPTGSHTITLKKTGTGTVWIGVYEGSNRGKLILDDQYFKKADTYTLTVSTTTFINVGRADLVSISVDNVPLNDGDKATSKKVSLEITK